MLPPWFTEDGELRTRFDGATLFTVIEALAELEPPSESFTVTLMA
jgi:hypothetical protein